jgi:predicted DCC family thiol-disulfide oxidoreductase YuxK
MEKIPNRLILFDPYCNLCSSLVKFILRRDGSDIFRFGSLFSDQGKQIKKALPWNLQKNTIIYFDQDEVYIQSDAAIRITTQLGGMYKAAKVFYALPKSFRDYLYSLIAKYRYKVFGKRKSPMVPPEKHRWKFIDQ